MMIGAAGVKDDSNTAVVTTTDAPDSGDPAARAPALPAASNAEGGAGDGSTTPKTTATPEPKTPTRKVRRIVRKNKKKGNRDKQDAAEVVDPVLLEKVVRESCLPKAYSFEIVKTLKRINQILRAKQQQHQQQQQQQQHTSDPNGSRGVHIALQMPEGLLLYATVLSDVLQRLVAATNKNTNTTDKDNNDNSGGDRRLLKVSVLGDVTYGACCVDDLGARALGCDLLVHYGHSCLVPIQHTVVPCLYVFVEITIDAPHLVECFHRTMTTLTTLTTTTTIPPTPEASYSGGAGAGASDPAAVDGDDAADADAANRTSTKPHVYLLGTIQFRHALMEARRLLRSPPYEYEVSIPQAKPLSPGEVLGCTSPVLASKPPTTSTKTRKEDNSKSNDNDSCCATPNTAEDQKSVVLFVADGRFHLESTMISNPHIFRFYRYDPYPKALTEESYDHVKMKSIRYEAIEKARLKIRTKREEQQKRQRQTSSNGSAAAVFGIILGTLGRQGNPALLTKIRRQLQKHNLRSFVVLASEITPSKLSLFRKKVDAWVQIACPRLSVDWGHHLSGDPTVPVLNPYELFSVLDPSVWRGGDDQSYPMDYYSQEGGPWSNYGDADNRGRQYTTTTTRTTTATPTASTTTTPVAAAV